MLYDPETGKRVKQPFNHITWGHSLLKRSNYNLSQCFFGEHLLDTDKHKPIALVESKRRHSLPLIIYLNICGWQLVESMDVSKAAISFLSSDVR